MKFRDLDAFDEDSSFCVATARPTEFWALDGPLPDADLMAQGENLQLKRRTTPKPDGE